MKTGVKNKGLYNSLIRFIGLTISGIGFVPYAIYKRGRVTKVQKEQIKKDYKILVTNLK